MKNILAVDLGTHTGVAYNSGPEFFCETWHLAADKELKIAKKNRLDRRKDIRIPSFYQRILDLRDWVDFDIVVFEDLEFSSYRLQMQLWSSLRAALWLGFPSPPVVLIECVGVKTLKLFAANHGNATKEMMSAALQREHPNQWSPTLDDNAIDAAWLWHWANTHLTRAPAGAIIPT